MNTNNTSNYDRHYGSILTTTTIREPEPEYYRSSNNLIAYNSYAERRQHEHEHEHEHGIDRSSLHTDSSSTLVLFYDVGMMQRLQSRLTKVGVIGIGLIFLSLALNILHGENAGDIGGAAASQNTADGTSSTTVQDFSGTNANPNQNQQRNPSRNQLLDLTANAATAGTTAATMTATATSVQFEVPDEIKLSSSDGSGSGEEEEGTAKLEEHDQPLSLRQRQ